MPTQRYLSLVSGVQTEVVPLTTSAGASSAGEIIALNSSGQVDATMLPASSSGPSLVVPRDLIYHMCGVDGYGSSWQPFNSVKTGPLYTGATGGSSLFSTSGGLQHEAASEYHQGTTGTSLTSCASWSFGRPRIPAGHDCSSRLIVNLGTTMNIIAWVSLLDTGLSNLTNVAGSPDIGKSSGIAMVALRYYPGDAHWMLYICDGTNPSQIIDTGVPPASADANSRIPSQVFDCWLTSAGVLTVAIDGAVVAGPLIPTHTLIGASAVYPFGQNRGWQSSLLIQNTTATAVSGGWGFGYLGVGGDKA